MRRTHGHSCDRAARKARIQEHCLSSAPGGASLHHPGVGNEQVRLSGTDEHNKEHGRVLQLNSAIAVTRRVGIYCFCRITTAVPYARTSVTPFMISVASYRAA